MAEQYSTIAEEIKNKLPADEIIYDLAEVFKVFGDSTRTKILSCLTFGELKVSDIAEACQMSVSAVSHQLRILRNAKLIRGRKDGKEVIYALDDKHVELIIECGLSHLREED
ncbi:MAG: metalloregulator ArsR/SmtB family transcription factor [Lachnospiraceae bacterium]|nr:metalloregulator ArsR/SmtB family transcription factor [Lachnospiraceae bacterium]